MQWRRLRSKRGAGDSSEDLPQALPSIGHESSKPRPSSPPARTDRSQSSASIDQVKDANLALLPRRHSAQSDISDFNRQLFPSQSSLHQRQRSQDRRDDPLGLTVLHAPDPQDRTVDILFIHGLGGTSLRTWCSKRDLDLLWPGIWLPQDTDLSTARILTFGYNAHFSSKKQQAALTISDFANDLLFSMKYGGDSDVKMGEVPIIVVAHSMGGLVFKKACVFPHHNYVFLDGVDKPPNLSPCRVWKYFRLLLSSTIQSITYTTFTDSGLLQSFMDTSTWNIARSSRKLRPSSLWQPPIGGLILQRR